MLRRLRRGSKIEKPTARQDNSSPDNANFLSLPAELRNVIYELTVQDTNLTLVPRKAKRAPPPAMLVVSRQVRAEYHPILLTQARVVANVFNYDFRDITSMASSLYSRDLKLLRLNEHMIIKLHCMRCRIQDLDSLRRWLVQRADSLDRLPWAYGIGWPGSIIALTAKPDVLIGHLEMLLDMKTRMRLDERLGWELLPLCEGIQKELGRVELEIAEKAAQR